MKKICILDYGLGNIKSLYNSIKHLGYDVSFHSEKKRENYDILFIPGIGSFSKASELLLKNKRYIDFINIHKKNSIIFGICLGMQILFEEGYEFGKNNGLNLVSGKIKKLDDYNNKILPFVGYQKVLFNIKNESTKFFKDFNNEKFYFIHSYYADEVNSNEILATSVKTKYCCAVKSKNIIGTQFHPEKSGEIGLEFLKSTINNI